MLVQCLSPGIWVAAVFKEGPACNVNQMPCGEAKPKVFRMTGWPLVPPAADHHRFVGFSRVNIAFRRKILLLQTVGKKWLIWALCCVRGGNRLINVCIHAWKCHMYRELLTARRRLLVLKMGPSARLRLLQLRFIVPDCKTCYLKVLY